jgi:maltose alpha-D-glucosyltransferase/alpha-amylase
MTLSPRALEPTSSLVRRAHPLTAIVHDWYKDAVIYELRVRSFYDSDGDGIGDLRGLTQKLGYLQDLGVTALWLLPFYPSPLRDDGYDISDYTAVHPEYGTIADFQRFLDEAHRRGLRVITELVLNHTSDQHPWFQRARRAPPDSLERSYYVWSDTPDRFNEARIIFPDYEPSNWSWDPVARAYYWHRFYAHQPDLNYENPAVADAMFEALDFWLRMGVDGLRLDAVPYLFEREGTTCENLPETHAFLRRMRAHIDARFQDRMLLAEANQWPEEAASYFGKGDECHMVFNFPVMPRIFVSIHLEDRFPLADILAQTPELADGCQWALFLRNHDELTLEMVTDAERDVMVHAYAAEPVMRVNLGIRRRLAPLAGNDRRRIELMNALLFSLPGTPVLYYGDEIGMGDNVYLGDRNGVRTPMQWSADKNAGFSRANPQKLVLPVIIDPDYHYEAVNVDTQQRTPGSLLWWTKRLVALRKRHAAFGRGSLELLRPDNPRILAFVRRCEGEVLLVVANLSRFVQFVELDLSAWKGSVPIELFGGSALPTVGDARLPLTLAGHGFYWFSLSPQPREDARAAAYEPPILDLGPWPAALAAEPDAVAELLAGWASAQAWFKRRDLSLDAARLADVVPASAAFDGAMGAHLVVLQLAFSDGSTDRYLVAPAVADRARACEIVARSPHAVVATLPDHAASEPGSAMTTPIAGASGGVLLDALADPWCARQILEAAFERLRIEGREGALVADVRPKAMLLAGERVLIDVRRGLEEGSSYGLELERLLASRGASAPVTPLVGAVEYVAARAKEPVPLAVARAFVHVEIDGAAHARAEVHRLLEQVLARGRDEPRPPRAGWAALRLLTGDVPELVRDVMGTFLDTARLLGRRTAELHLALTQPNGRPDLAPEPTSMHDQRAVYQSMRTLAGRCLRELARAEPQLAPGARALARRILTVEDAILARFGALLRQRISAPRTRHVGGLDLRAVLLTGNDLIFADLEGDGTRSTGERRRKSSPLRDVAGLIRSLHEATFSVLLDASRVRAEDVEAARPWAWAFWEGATAALLDAYVVDAEAAHLLPSDPAEIAVLLDAFLLESALATVGKSVATGEGQVESALELVASILETAD